MLADNWYDLVSEAEVINQGDILIGCPIIVLPDHPLSYPDLRDKKEFQGQATVYFDNVVILTQGCLIAGPGGRKVDVVTVAKIEDVKGEEWGFVKEVSMGRRPAYHLISKSYEPSIPLNYQLVDFTNIHTVPYQLLDSFRANTGSRLRLKSPYVEELSQRFGLFYSKIGLPNGTIDEVDLRASI